ncbi:transcription termination factor 1, mitochondrial isoform X3 [Lepus europaeus]|uniref:transcription termination factor 1, mitochondrial isoform X3 n=1 Tax=Lepus europaeus TaxID=9983 RepID=UPI002B48540B|nr:transcription termination factor 1, mitochondrial isoform X3 [Lepus europaeus]
MRQLFSSLSDGMQRTLSLRQISPTEIVPGLTLIIVFCRTSYSETLPPSHLHHRITHQDDLMGQFQPARLPDDEWGISRSNSFSEVMDKVFMTPKLYLL